MSCTYGIEQSCDECRMCKKNENKKVKVTEAEIVVHGILEKPYFEIRYLEVGKKEYNVGYSSYDLKNVFGWLNEEFEIVKEKENKKQSNADRIRSMTDEELAEFLTKQFCHGVGENLIKEWLESEVEE